MGRIKRLVILFFVCTFVQSCSFLQTQEKTKKENLDINYTPIKEYSIDWSKFNKIKKPTKAYLDSDFNQVDSPSKATYVLFTKSEYAKYVALLKLTVEYKKLAKNQEELINSYIRLINSHKELVKIEEAKCNAYIQLYEASEKAYRSERLDHKIDNVVHKIFIGGLLAGLLFTL